MSKYMKIALVALILAAGCWFTEIVISPSGFELILGVAAIVSSLICICFFAICIARKLRRRISPYRIFAITDGCIGLCVLAYAV